MAQPRAVRMDASSRGHQLGETGGKKNPGSFAKAPTTNLGPGQYSLHGWALHW